MTTRKKRPKLFLLEEREYHSPLSGIFFKVKNLTYRRSSLCILSAKLFKGPGNGNLIYLRHRKMARENTNKPQGFEKIFLYCVRMSKISKKFSI